MALSVEGSRFKSAFGKLEPPTRSINLKHLTKTSAKRHYKPISFFESQKLDPAQFYQGGEQIGDD